MPTCTKCKEKKSVEEMSLDAKRHNGISSWCKKCRSLSAGAWKGKNTERLKLAKQKYYASNYDYLTARGYMLKHRYGLSLGDYDEMLEHQGRACAICNKSVDDMTYHLFVDHCHATGTVRGLLCSPCNTFLGHLKDDPKLMQNAIDYLERKVRTK